MNKIKITEEMHLEKEWFEQARKQNFETLPDFIDHIMNDYIHDYGTVCHGVAACALAAAWAANNSEGAEGGITGFQSGFVMWDFVKQWGYLSNKCGLKMIDYDKMLYPQCDNHFAKTISADVWEALQERAKELLSENNGLVHPDVFERWKTIADGIVPSGFAIKY